MGSKKTSNVIIIVFSFSLEIIRKNVRNNKIKYGYNFNTGLVSNPIPINKEIIKI